MIAPRRILVVGLNVAGLQAAEKLRALGFDGSLTLLDADAEAPYNRPPLSKEFLAGEFDEDDIQLLSDSELEALGANTWLGVQARSLDQQRKVVETSNGDLPYDALLISTGAAAFVPESWAAWRGVHALRSLSDARSIRDALVTGARVVVIGGGLIGCEVAASARKLGLDVTLVEADSRLMGRLLPDTLSAPLAQLHRDRGVRVLCDAAVQQLQGADGEVTGVQLADGQVVPADVVIVGIGARPNTTWLATSDLTLRNGVVTDAALCAGPGVYAAGDVACVAAHAEHPGERAEHWTNARQHGSLAAASMLGRVDEHMTELHPYVWSDQYDLRLQVFGTAFGDQLHTLSRDDEGQHVTLVGADGHVVGAVGFGAKGFVKAKKYVTAATPWSDLPPLADGVRA